MYPIILVISIIFFSPNTRAVETGLEQRVARLEQEVHILRQRLEILTEKIQAACDLTKRQKSSLSFSPARLKQLQIKRWYYRPEQIKFNTYYAIDVELLNNFGKDIKEVDARVHFKNLLGDHLYSISITPNIKIPAGQTVIDKGSHQNKRLLGKRHQILEMDVEDIDAELVVRKLVFNDGTIISF